MWVKIPESYIWNKPEKEETNKKRINCEVFLNVFKSHDLKNNNKNQQNKTTKKKKKKEKEQQQQKIQIIFILLTK